MTKANSRIKRDAEDNIVVDLQGLTDKKPEFLEQGIRLNVVLTGRETVGAMTLLLATVI